MVVRFFDVRFQEAVVVLAICFEGEWALAFASFNLEEWKSDVGGEKKIGGIR